jgi:hypothetical protein
MLLKNWRRARVNTEISQIIPGYSVAYFFGYFRNPRFGRALSNHSAIFLAAWKRCGGADEVAEMTKVVADPAAAEVVAAFKAAQHDGHSTADGYRAAVRAWRRRHPDHAPTYAALQAVKILLKKREKLLIQID